MSRSNELMKNCTILIIPTNSNNKYIWQRHGHFKNKAGVGVEKKSLNEEMKKLNEFSSVNIYISDYHNCVIYPISLIHFNLCSSNQIN